VLHALKDWLWGHPLLYGFILFALSLLGSIYSQEIRAFLHSWPRTKEHRRRVKQTELSSRIELLKKLHNDSYQLLLFLAGRIAGDCFKALVLVILMLVASGFTKIKPQPGTYIWLLCGWFTGMFQWLNGVMKQLHDFDATVATLQSQLSELKRETTAE
jgi:hypothetical protein